MNPLQVVDDFEDAPTVEIPRATMEQVIAAGRRVEDDVSDGVPISLEGTEDTEPSDAAAREERARAARCSRR